jgi:hypothetical protein
MSCSSSMDSQLLAHLLYSYSYNCSYSYDDMAACYKLLQSTTAVDNAVVEQARREHSRA